jgi:hypothetical protein
MPEPSTLTSPDGKRERRIRLVAVVAGVLALLYGVLIAGQILAPIALLLWAFLVYLAWRFVRAHERIAAAAETMATAGRRESTEPKAARTEPETATTTETTPVDDEATDSAEE